MTAAPIFGHVASCSACAQEIHPAAIAKHFKSSKPRVLYAATISRASNNRNAQTLVEINSQLFAQHVEDTLMVNTVADAIPPDLTSPLLRQELPKALMGGGATEAALVPL